jgi:hypothetical protein
MATGMTTSFQVNIITNAGVRRLVAAV